jgi:hypothetical protein
MTGEKSKRQCAGYKTEFDILHRNEVPRLAAKMRRRGVIVESLPDGTSASSAASSSTASLSPPAAVSSSRHQSLSGASSAAQAATTTDLIRREPPTPPTTLIVPVRQQASCYFASNFILMPLGGPDCGFLEYVVPLIDKQPAGSPLRHAFDACALAALGNRKKSSQLGELALREHTNALARTHLALSNPAEWKKDSTLAAILLMSIYEVGNPFPML